MTTVRISKETIVGSENSHLESALPYSFPENRNCCELSVKKTVAGSC